MTRAFRSAIFLQFMGTVGSGIFVLPYLFYHSNIVFASFFLVFLAIVTGALNQFYCQIISATPGDHQLGGYAQIYLGNRFKKLAILNLVLLGFGAITAYLKLFSSFLPLLIPVSSFTASLIFLSVLVIFHLLKPQSFSPITFIISAFTILIPIILFIFSLSSPNISYTIFQVPNFSFYGATLFALSGFTIIPEIDEVLRRHQHSQHETTSLASILGLLLVVIIYLVFIFSVISLSGTNLTVNSISGLAVNYPILGKLIALFGIFITTHATLNFLNVFHEVFFRDLKFSRQTSTLLSLVFPFLSFLLSSISLISIISLTGGITIFISSLIIIFVRIQIPRSFWTDFFIILILICLLAGLIFSF